MKRWLIGLCLFAVTAFAQIYPPANPPDYVPPVLLNDRTQEILDPQTGMLFKRVTLPDDTKESTFWGKATAEWYGAGNFRACSEWTLADGGYLCVVPTMSGGPGLLYWVHGDSGVVQFRGVMFMPGSADPVYGWSYVGMEGGAPWDMTEVGIAWQTRAGWLLRGVYSDPGKELPSNSAATFTWTKFADVKMQYETQYPGTLGPGSVVWVNGDYLTLRERMYYQDSPGVVSVYSKSRKRFLGRVESWSRPECRWCGLHSTAPVVAPFPVVNLTVQTLCGNAASGPYASKLTAAVLTTGTVFTVDGEPQNEDPLNGPRQLQTVAVGDVVGINGCHGSEQERMTITGKTGNTWTMKRGVKPQAWPVGTRLVMLPNAVAPEYWYDPLSDRLVPDPNQAGSHRATVYPWDVTSDYSVRKFATINDLLTKPWEHRMSWIIKGTETGFSYPNHQTHVSLHAPSNTMFDVMPVSPDDALVPNKAPQMGALLQWDIGAPSPRDTVQVRSHLLSAPHKINWLANVHALPNGKWVMGQAANSGGIFLMRVSGATTPPAAIITWSAGGPLPVGVTLTPGGALTVDPSVTQVGTHKFFLAAAVSDGWATVAVKEFTITVEPKPEPPPPPPNPPPPQKIITITTPGTLPPVTVGDIPYTIQLMASVA